MRSFVWRKAARVCVGGAVLCVSISTASAAFTEISAIDSGITHVQAAGIQSGPAAMTGGAAAGDFDGDGLVDLFFTRIDAPDVLYKNLGNGSFQDVSFNAGFTSNLPTNGPVFGDIDNDGDLDLYVSAVVPISAPGNRYYLYINNGDGTFSEDATARGADITTTVPTNGMGIALGDYNRDGYLDAMTSDWNVLASQSSSRLLRNQGVANPGRFDDVTTAAGLDVYPATTAYRFSPRFSDMDGDGNPDIAIAADFLTSQLFWNNGDGTFTDGTAAAQVGTDRAGMGSTIGDYDGDGDLDWYVTAIVNGDPAAAPEFGNRLYRNEGGRVFSEQTDAAGVRPEGWWWGTTWLDYDNDGNLDLMATNGMPGIFDADPTTLWRNNGDGTFTDVTTAEGVTDTAQGRGLLTFDYDNDGDLDTLVINHGGAPVLYRNDSANGNAWLRVKTIGTESNRDGIGARIIIDPDSTVVGDEQLREIDGGSNYLSQNEMIAHFGLGSFVGTIDSITIQWPSGITQQFTDVVSNQVLIAVETILSGDLNGDGFVGVDDLNIVLVNWNQTVTAGDLLSGDPTGEGFVGVDDLNLVLVNWNNSTPPSGSTNIPEPGSVTVMALCGLVLLRHRVRRTKPYARARPGSNVDGLS
jgi:enediyne biosynthesis protein E4